MSNIRLVKKEENHDNIRFGINQDYYNEVVRRLQNTNVNETVDLINSGKYLDSDTLKKHKERLKQYKSDFEFLNEIQKLTSNDYDESSYIESSKWLEDFSNVFNERESIFSKFKNEYEFNDAVKIGELNDMPSAEILPHLDHSGTADERSALISRQTELENQLRELGSSGNKGVGAKKKLTLNQKLNDVKKQISNLDKSDIAYTTSGGQNITWSSLYNKKKDEEDFNALYNEMSANPDWEEHSKYKPTYDTSKGGRNPFNAGDDDYERANHPNVSVNGTQDIYYALQTNEKEKELFNYLAHTKGTEYALDWLMSREDVYKERQSRQNIENAQKMAKEVPVLSDAIAVVGSLVTPFEYLGNVMTGNGGERTASADMSSAIKGTRMEQIDWEVGEWDAFDFLYGTGTSMAESALAMATFGGAGGVSLGLNAAAQSTNDALDRGMSKGQAFTSGVASGIFEGIFESWSIGAFSDLTKNLKRADFRNIAKYVGKNMWNNAKEETLTEIANIAWDYLSNGEFSQYETAIRQYMNSGMSESDAKLQVAKELGVQVAEAAGSGALMGFGFGVGGGIKARQNIAESGKEIKDAGEVRNLVDLGKSLGEGTESYKYANKITDKSKAFAIGQLLGIEADDIKSANKGEIVKSLERKGYDTEKANHIADLMLDPKNTTFDDSRAEKTYNDIINNPNSTVSQRNEAYEGILHGVDENKLQRAISKAVKDKSAIAPQKTLTEEQGNLLTQEENPVESKFESNLEGKDFNSRNDKIIASKKLVSSEKDNMKFEVTYEDGATDTVDANDINFSNEGEALVYSNVMDMNVPVGIAEELISGYNGNDVKSAATYINGMREAFVLGKFNQEADLRSGAFASQLTEEQRNNIFKLGGIYANEKAIADEKAIKGDTKPTDIKKQEGKVHFEGDKLSLKSVQDVSLKSLNVLSKALGKDIHIFESYKDANGKRVYKDANGNIKKAPNGFYRQLDGSIWIDLNAGKKGEGTIMYTVAHELTHFIKQWSPTKFKALADFLVEQYGKNGESVANLVREQQAKAKRNGRELSYDAAFEEMVADSMETMLTDGKVIRELAHKDKGLFNKIKSWIDNLLRKLNKEYKNYTPETTEGKMISEMKKTFEEAQRLFADALVDASDNYSNSSVRAEKNTTSKGDVKESKRLGGYFPEINVSTKDISVFGIKDINDIKEVKLKVYNYLLGKYVSNDKISKPIKNIDTDMDIYVYWGGIDETFGNANAYKNLFAKKKKIKLATMTSLAKLIKYGEVRSPESPNIYNSKSKNVYAYLTAPITVDGVEYMVNMDIKKTPSGNRFYIHTIKIADESPKSNNGSTKLTNSSAKDNIPQTSKKSQEKLSDRDEMQERYNNLQKEYTRLEKEAEALKTSKEYLDFVDSISLLQGEELDNAIRDYGEWTHKSGLYAKSKRMSEIIGEQKDIRAALDKEKELSRDAYMKSVENLTEKEKMDFVDRAVKRYGTTNRVSLASYLMLNGKMLDFSDGQGYRVQDHREISEILDMPDTTGYSDGLIAFMNMGNIRMQTYGIDISHTPNQAQKSALRDIISQIMRNENEFTVDFSKTSGYTDGSVTYPKGTATSKIFADIDSYFETGVVPEYNSSVAEFRYSDRDKAYMETVNNGDMEKAQLMVIDAALKSGLNYTGLHGTEKFGFTKFDRNKNHLKGAHFFTNKYRVAESYSGEKGITKVSSNAKRGNYEVALDIKNPLIIDCKGNLWNDIPFDIGTSGKVSTPDVVTYAEKHGYDGVIFKNVVDAGHNLTADDEFDILYTEEGKKKWTSTVYAVFDSNQIKSLDTVTYDDNGNVIPLSERFNPANEDIRFSDRDEAPIFYSQMGKVVEGVKQEKLAANSVVNMLRGKGVKAEEIRWSGIVPFLEGKKSITKQELLDFINGSMLQIGEQMSDTVDIEVISEDGDNYIVRNKETRETLDEWEYSDDVEDGLEGWVNQEGEIALTVDEIREKSFVEFSSTRWSEYKLNGGENYREIVFTMPNSSYSNQMMRVHWGEDAEGVLVHARIQDFEVDGKKMLFIEEIQSDWHNEGHKVGYAKNLSQTESKRIADLDKMQVALVEQMQEKYQKGDIDGAMELHKQERKLYLERQKIEGNRDGTPDAPFKENYHEFVLKRLLRMAAEQGYDSIGWTPANIQSERWSDEFAEAYRIEYDQEMPKFLKKYGRQWGAKVEKTPIPKQTVDGRQRILKETELKNVKRDIESAKRELARHYDSYEKARIQMSIDSMEKTVATLEQELSTSLDVWSMDITDSMKESVLYEGQTLYSERDDNSVSTRSLLANALEGAAQNEIEKNKLAQYKEKIALIEAEQNKLHELREKLFTKGIKGDERREIQEEATRTANRINTYDRQLFNLESTTALKNVLNREKELARKRQKQKDNENLRAYKEKVAETTRQLLEKNRESRQKALEGRSKTEMRHKVKKVVNDLNNLLLKPTKERHVPEKMRIAVAEALAIVNMDTVDADTRVARLNEKIAKANDPDVIASLTESRDRILEQGNKLGEKLAKLKDAYGMVRDSADDSLKSMYDDVIYNKIESVQKKVGKTPLRSMTLEQLENVYELYKMVLTTVRDSNKAFAEDLKMTRQALGSNTFAEIKDNNKSRDRIKFEGIENFGWANLKPMQAIKTIGSGILQKLWNNILYGQEVFAQDYDEAVKFAKEMKEKYGYNKWNLHKLYSFESKSGKLMKINLEQMMSIYAYSKRKQADEHIEFGGILLNTELIKVKEKDKHGIPRVVKYKINDKNAYRLNKMQVGEIIATLEKEFPGAKDFVDEMQKYLSETMGAKGNEVSMKMYGIKLFKEEHYFPLKSSKDFMEAANDKLKGDVKIKNKGMTKSTVEHANNPIVLEGFLNVWGNHINEMAMYHGLVLPLEDFSRTLNYGFKADDKLNTDAESVKTALGSAFGESAEKYLNELLKAINGGVLHDSSDGIANKMISKFKKAKVMASLSVIVQQPTAIIRAMGIIEPRYFVAQNFHHKATWEELKKYCPTAIIKETGSFDTNMGRTIVDMIKEDRSFTDKVGDTLGKAPAYMDEMGWNMIWRALKNKVATEQKLSGEELLKECGRQMTLIINETQVYDSVMSRNEMMRSKSALTKMATAFMGEPSTVANMIYGAVLDFKRGKKGIASKTVAAVISSVVINGLVSSLVYAFRDDDEEKTWLEKYLASATTEVIDGINPLTYIPYVKDAYSLFQGYDVERTDMAIIGDVAVALNDFFDVLDPEMYEDMSRGEIAKHIYENAKPLLTSICDMFGLPVGNILRDAEAIIVNDNLPMSKTSSEGSGLAVKEGWLNASLKFVEKFVDDEKYHKLYLIANNGDTAYVKNEVSEMVAEKVDLDTTEKQAKTNVRSSFTGVYRDIYKKAYKNKDAEEMNRIRKFLYATGLWNSLNELDSLLAKWRKAD